MKTKLTQAFRNHKALISFVVAGDPDFKQTVDHVVALAEAGCDIVELGIPFSDPVADGPEIQAADLRAFDSKTTPERVFEMVAAIREQTDIPLVFLTYANLVYQYGYVAFAKRCAALRVSGLIIPDLPLEEQGELRPALVAQNVALIPLIAPTTTPDRIAAIAKAATGFIYVVSSMGVTGMRQSLTTDLTPLITAIRAETDTPIAIGFGIHTPEQAQKMAEQADGVIVGSAMVHEIASQQDVVAKLTTYTYELRQAVDSVAN